MVGNIVKIVVIVGLVVLAIFVVSKEIRRPGLSKESAENAPPFSLPDVNGNVVRLSDLKGKVVFVNFWATWCPPCRDEIPSFIELYNQYKDKGFEIVGISLDGTGVKDVKPFVEQFRINYKVLLGNDKVAEMYGGIQGIPTTFVVDRRGKIQKTYIGPRSKGEFEADIKALL